MYIFEALIVPFVVIAGLFAIVGRLVFNKVDHFTLRSGDMKQGEPLHPGISAHKLPVGGGFAGFLVVLACVISFAGRIPPIRYFLALSVIAGIAIAIVLRRLYR